MHITKRALATNKEKSKSLLHKLTGVQKLVVSLVLKVNVAVASQSI
jgi:hypothetical protein